MARVHITSGNVNYFQVQIYRYIFVSLLFPKNPNGNLMYYITNDPTPFPIPPPSKELYSMLPMIMLTNLES